MHFSLFEPILSGCAFWTEINLEQESPPAWTQEAYRLPRSKYTLCCSARGYPLPPPTWPGQGVPPSWDLTRTGGYPSPPPHLDLGREYPAPIWEGGTPPPGSGKGTPPISQMVVPPPPTRNGGQSKNITFRHPSDAGGKKVCQRNVFYFLLNKLFAIPHTFRKFITHSRETKSFVVGLLSVKLSSD